MNNRPSTGEAAGTEPRSHLFGRSTAVETSDVGERVVLYHRESGKSLVLNPSGTWLWRQMDAPLTSADLAERLQRQFPSLDAESACRDVETYLHSLSEHGAITETS